MDEMEDFLKGETIEAVEVSEVTETTETPEVAEPEQSEGRVRDEKGRFAPKGAEKSEEAVSPTATEAPLDHAALIGERRRRQEAEDRLRQLEEAIRTTQQAPQQQAPAQAQVPDRWEDPDGYDQWLIAQAAAMARAEASQTFQTQRIQAAALEVMQRLPDYQEKIGVFEQMATANPALLQEMVRSPNPAEYAYNMARTQLEISQYGGIDGLINARVQEALKAQPAPTSIPETLASEQSGRAAIGGAPGNLTLDDILKR